MQTVGIAAADHETSRELVYDDHFAVVDDVILVAVEQFMRFERLLDMVVERRVVDVAQVLDIEKPFGFRRTQFRDLHAPVLAVDDVIPVAVLAARLKFLVDLLFDLADLFGRLFDLLFFLFLLFLVGVLFVHAVVVEPAFEGTHESVHALVEFRGLVPLARNDERRSRLVDQNRVHFVDDAERKFALHHLIDIRFQIVAEVIESEFVVGRIGDIAVIRFLLIVVVHAGHDHADGKPQKAVHFAHPLGVALRKIVVDRDDMHALARERREIRGERRDQRLAFARLHFRDTSLIKSDTADDLHVVVL